MPALVKKSIITDDLGDLFLPGAWCLLLRNGDASVTQTDGDASTSGSRSGMQEPRWETLTDYAKDHLLRFGAIPWTAPAFDDRRVTADPRLYCLSSMQVEDANGHWQDFTCTCLTEQGTVYEITQGECRTLARQGPVFNPYKEERRDAQTQSSSASETVARSESAPAGSVVHYRAGSRGDVFPRSPGYESGQTYTGPTTGL